MSNTTIGTVQVILSAQHEKMTKAFGEAAKQVAAFRNTVLGVVGAWASIATAKAAAAFIKHNMDIADAMEDQAEQIGVTVEKLGGLRLAAMQTGMTSEKFATSMGKMQQAMVALRNGSPEIENALRGIGVSLDELRGKSADEQLAVLADAFAETEDASLAAATALKLFGKGGLEMIPVLNGGSAGLQQAAKDAEAFGIAISGVEIGQITEAKTVLAQVESVVESLGLRITAEFSPYITALGHEFLNAARESNGFRSQIAAFVEGGVRGAVAVYDAWMRLREVWSAVRIGVMWMADKVLGAADNIGRTGKWIAEIFTSAFEVIKATGATVVEGLKISFYTLKHVAVVVLDEITQLGSAAITKLADAAGYVSEELQFKLMKAAVAMSEATAGMRKQTAADLAASADSSRQATARLSASFVALGNSMASVPEGSATIAEWRANLTGNMQAEVETLNQIDTERLANVAKVEAAILTIKSQAEERAADVDKKKQIRIAAARNATNSEEIEAERKKNMALLGETSNFFDALGGITADAAEKNRALFYVNRGAAMAQAGINAWMAYSNTLASPALISNPMLAQVFASAQLALGMTAIAKIAGENPPGRANGGPTSRGGIYQVNERGPEMLTVGDKSFLMMGNKGGTVTPGGPGGGSPKVEVHVHTPPGTTARTEQSMGEGGAPRLDVIVEAVANKMAGDVAAGTGPMARTLQSTYGLNRSRGSAR